MPLLRPLSNLLNPQIGLGIFLACMLVPDPRLKNPRVRMISKALVISTAKSTPPRRAFEEVLRLTGEEKVPVSAPGYSAPTIQLNESLTREKVLPVSTLFNRRVHLNAMHITRFEAQPVSSRTTSTQDLKSKTLPLTTLAGRTPQNFSAPSGSASLGQASEQQLSEDWYASLTPRQKRILEASGMEHSPALSDEHPQTLSEALAEKVDEELAAMGQLTQLGGVKNSSAVSPASGATSGAVLPAVVPGNYRVSGHVYLDDKTPLLPNHHIEVHWLREGIAKKTQVMPQTQSAFDMDVTELVGQVRAEMYDESTGQVVAAGSLRLSPGLPAAALRDAQLKMQPLRSVVARYSDFYRQSGSTMANVAKRSQAKPVGPIVAKASFDRETKFTPDLDGALFIDGVSPMSTAFAYTESKDYYPAIHMLTAGQGEDSLPLLPKKTANALIQIVEEQLGYTSAQKNGALILGQVVSDGTPVIGAKVTVEGESQMQPVYLNEILIPDPKLQATTSTGYFVLVHPTEGYYSFRAEKAGRFVGFGNTTAEAATSTFVKIEQATSSAPFELRSFNAFTGEGIATQVEMQSNDQVFDIEAYGMVEHPLVPGQVVAQVEPTSDEYLPSLYPYDGKDDHLYMPLLKKSWVDELITRSHLNIEPDTGMIVGFTHKGGFEMSLPHLDESAQVRVIYFDAQGLETPAPVDQGGFILVNVPDMAQTVVLTDAMGQTLSEVMPVDAGWLTTARFDL